ncbi:hypothetical protein [Demequina sp. NBRC 110053]|uniref:hypothetical protein n=1 Tax=Demequina sp. NBRC 110053 TaxID=1570342 RepID=UPI000A037BE4|nr:hypothetical protein [Demequina sp. NBRC 110053]
MTVRMTEEQDAQLTALAQRWGVSKNEAIVRAVDEAVRGESTDADYMDDYEHVSAKYRDALDKLGNV